MDWKHIAAAQDGVIGRGQLRSCGVAQSSVDRLRDREVLVAAAPRTYLVRGAPLTWRAKLWAARLSTDGVLGFATAARLWGIAETGDDPVHVVVPHSRRIFPPGWVRVHRVPVGRVVEREDGLPITSRPWTVMDYATMLRPREWTALADRAVQRGWLTAADIEHRLENFKGRVGNQRWRVLLCSLRDGAAAESERVLHRLLRQAGLRGWKPNYEVWANGALLAVVDVALPERRIAIEVDGWAFHSDVARFQRDRTRQNDLTMLGWTVLRFTWSDLVDRPGYVLSVLRRAAA